MSMVSPRDVSAIASSNSALRRFTCVGLNTRAGTSLASSACRTSSSPRGAVADMQVHNSGLAAHQPAHVRLGRNAEQFIECRLARAMVADGHLADPDDFLDERDVTAHRAGERRERNVIAAGMTPGAETQPPQPPGDHDEFGRRPHGIVGAEHPTAAVMPPAVRAVSCSGGTRVWGPASPPPPVRWTWPSISPGMTRRPARSTSSALSAAGIAGSEAAMATIRPPAMSRSCIPRRSGAKTSARRSSSNDVRGRSGEASCKLPTRPLRREGDGASFAGTPGRSFDGANSPGWARKAARGWSARPPSRVGTRHGRRGLRVADRGFRQPHRVRPPGRRPPPQPFIRAGRLDHRTHPGAHLAKRLSSCLSGRISPRLGPACGHHRIVPSEGAALCHESRPQGRGDIAAAHAGVPGG